MTLRFALFLIPLTFASCSMGTFFENYTMPTGYANLDTTPISSPHGYNKTPEQEGAVRDVIAVDAEAWRNGIASAIMPISSVLDMNKPVAVIADPSLSPLNASAANYARDLLIDMSYLIATPKDTDQHLQIDARRTGKDSDNLVRLNLAIVRNGTTYASRTVEIMVPHQISETGFLPDLSFINDNPPPAPPAPPGNTYNDDATK